MYTWQDYLGSRSYPGRGVFLGQSPDGNRGVIAYFIMGRSENSRNRIFVADGDGLRTQAFDEAKVTDPSLIIYRPVRVLGNTTIVSNGDQTDTIYDYLQRGADWEAALRTREYEPDAPNFTPRISGLLEVDNVGLCLCSLSILKKRPEDDGCLRHYWQYRPDCGQGQLIHTYADDGNPLPSFNAYSPILLPTLDDAAAFAELLWQSLNEENKVALFVRYLDLYTGACQDIIHNKHQ